MFSVLKSKAGSMKRRIIMVRRLDRETLTSMDIDVIIHSITGRLPHTLTIALAKVLARTGWLYVAGRYSPAGNSTGQKPL